jgi:YgiT-type zinc finger domain-containing protein
MKCTQYGHRTEITTGIHRYEESGLKNVMLMNVPMYKCTSCGETEVEIPATEELHCLLGLFVLYQPDRLGSAEVRHLRKLICRSDARDNYEMGIRGYYSH